MTLSCKQNIPVVLPQKQKQTQVLPYAFSIITSLTAFNLMKLVIGNPHSM